VDNGFAVREVRGSEVRCVGSDETPHEEVRIAIPPHREAVCPICGRRFRRSPWWNRLTEAIWPRPP
jgi:uncharacterized Zn-finger protein